MPDNHKSPVICCVLSQMTTKLTKLTGELEEEKQLNRCLRDNQSTWQSRVAELEDGLAKKDIVSIVFLSRTLLISAPSPGVYYFLLLTLSVCPAVCLFVTNIAFYLRKR